jgi:iron complex outermembrane receptor protein
VNARIVQPVGAGSLSAYYAWSDRAETDYQDLSYGIIARRGWDWDNWYPDWDGAVAAADACAASGFADGVSCDDAYWNASGLREDHLGYVALDLPFGDAVDLHVQGYLHKNEGQGLWGTPYLPTPGGAPLSIRTTEYEIDRKGAIGGLSFRAGTHTLTAGLWLEDNDFNQARRFYGEPDRGAPSRSFLSFQRDPLLTQFEYDFNTRTVQWYLQDSWQVTEALRVDAGFKSTHVENDLTPVIAIGSRPNVASSIDAKEGFLPQAGFSWAFSDAQEIFGSYAENMRAFVSAATAGPFSTTQAGFDAIRDTLDPETSRTVEIGWRFRTADLQGVVSVYDVSFKDRLLSIALGPGIIGAPSALANVGEVRTRGFEAGLLWTIAERWNLLGSYSHADSSYRDDVVTGTGAVVDVSGKDVVDTPRHMLKLEGGYDDGQLFARLGVDYMSKRYFTYLNDQSVKSRTLLDASVGYRFEPIGLARELTLQLNATNLTDRKYVSTIGSNGFGNSGDAQTLLRGAPRQVFVSLDARF